MPKLWTESIDAHKRAVRDATLDAAAALVAERGVRGVTMAAIAQTAGIGRATLYKYFPDIDAILLAWHERQIATHLGDLAALRAGDGDALARLEAVLNAYALIHHEHRRSELAALLHQGEHVARAERHVRDLLRGLVAEGAAAGLVRDDVPADEVAVYCLHACSAASELASKAASRRLVRITMDGLAP